MKTFEHLQFLLTEKKKAVNFSTLSSDPLSSAKIINFSVANERNRAGLAPDGRLFLGVNITLRDNYLSIRPNHWFGKTVRKYYQSDLRFHGDRTLFLTSKFQELNKTINFTFCLDMAVDSLN